MVASEFDDLMGNGRLEEALDLLRSFARQEARSLYDQSVILCGRYAAVAREVRQGTLSRDDSLVEVARIRQAALALANEITDGATKSVGPASLLVREVPDDSVEVQVEHSAIGELVSLESSTISVDLHPSKLQRTISVNRFRQIDWLRRGLDRSKAVCKVHTSTKAGTGFLVSKHILMTNNHLIENENVAREGGTKAEFNYELKLEDGDDSLSIKYSLDPDRCFKTCPILDYTLVGVAEHGTAGAPGLDCWGVVPVNQYADPNPHDRVAIIQHPNGQPKQITLEGQAVRTDSPKLLYALDTMEGSSGSPVFNDRWHVIAIHRKGGPRVFGNLTNEGVLMSAIFEDLGGEWPT